MGDSIQKGLEAREYAGNKGTSAHMRIKVCQGKAAEIGRG
jgi:hypothetical protein